MDEQEDNISLWGPPATRVAQEREPITVGGRCYTVLGPLSDGQRAVLAPNGAYGLGTLRKTGGWVEVRRKGQLLRSYKGRSLIRGVQMLVREEYGDDAPRRRRR